MRQPLALVGLMLTVALAVPPSVHHPPSPRDGMLPVGATAATSFTSLTSLPPLPATFDRHDIDKAHLAILHALRDVIPWYNSSTTPRDVYVNRRHDERKKPSIKPDREDIEKGKANAECSVIRQNPINVVITALCFVDYDHLYFGFDKSNDPQTSITVTKRIEQRYRERSSLEDNDVLQVCSLTRGPVDSGDYPDECCYVHWSWVQHMKYNDIRQAYAFPDPLYTNDATNEVVAYVVCLVMVRGSSCAAALSSHRDECSNTLILWDFNQGPPPPAVME